MSGFQYLPKSYLKWLSSHRTHSVEMRAVVFILLGRGMCRDDKSVLSKLSRNTPNQNFWLLYNNYTSTKSFHLSSFFSGKGRGRERQMCDWVLESGVVFNHSPQRFITCLLVCFVCLTESLVGPGAGCTGFSCFCLSLPLPYHGITAVLCVCWGAQLESYITSTLPSESSVSG